MSTPEMIMKELDALDFRMFMSKQADNAYSTSGRHAEDIREFWRLKNELDNCAARH